MNILHGEAISDSHPHLLDVFRDGYAQSYVGDAEFQRSYLDRAHLALLDDRREALNGAALIRNARITAIATRTDKQTYGSRFESFVNLLETAHEIKEDAWIGIGLQVKPSVRAGAEQAGMSPSRDLELLEARLEKTGRMSSFAIRTSETGLLISLAGSNHGDDYWQEVWDFSES